MTRSPPVYLDECIDQHLTALLRDRGFDVFNARGSGMQGASDDEQLRYAAGLGAVLISHNRRDFQRLHQRWAEQGMAHSGIIIIPVAPLERSAIRCAMLMDWLMADSAHKSRLLTWGELQYQLTQGLRLPGYSDAELDFALGRRASL